MSLQALNGGSSTYAGELNAMPFVNAALQASRTLAEKNIDIRTNIKYKSVLQSFSGSNFMEAASCNWTEGPNLNVNEVVIEPKEFQVNETLCKQTLHDDWQSKFQMMSAHDNIPDSFEAYALAYIANVVGSDLETLIWKGKSTGSTNFIDGKFQGIFEEAKADTDVNDTAALSTYSSLTAAQAISSLETVIDTIPERVYSQGAYKLPIYVPTKVFQLLIQQYGGDQNGIGNMKEMFWNGQFSGISLHGHPIVYAPGIDSVTGSTTQFALCTYKDNLVFGTGLIEDMVDARVIDMAKTDGSRNVRLVMRLTAGTKIVHGEDVVLGQFA